MDSSFTKVSVNVPKLSGFDKSHQHLLTTRCGTITPILTDVLIPGSKANVKLALSASLPPLASDTFMRCSIKCEAFFVPFRLLAGSFESWFTDESKRFANGTEFKGVLPCLWPDSPQVWIEKFGTGSLADYLGYKIENHETFFDSSPISALPFLAYHKCFSDWYRNSLVQQDVFLPVDNSGAMIQNNPTLASSPWTFWHGNQATMADPGELTLADGVNILDLRQRNFGLDYFTTATPTAQQGEAKKVSFGTSGATGEFTIAALRAANSLQQFAERNNLAGNQYVDQIYARYGVRPSDGVAQRSLFIGSAEFEVYNKGIYQTAESSSEPGPNPFSRDVGNLVGSAKALGNENIVSDFEAKEPGILLINATLVPRVTYSTGVRRYLTNFCGEGSLADLANPILQNVGVQPIYQHELDGEVSPTGTDIFGYTDRYAEYKTMNDELSGIVRDGYSLESFALQRSFADSDPKISSDFLQIPIDFMDQVTATTSALSDYGCWIDTYFEYHVSQPLAKYSLPTLQDPAYEHGHSITVHRGGIKL